MSTPDIAAVQQAAMDAENRRRELASQRPGHGSPVPIAEPPAGASTGKPYEAGVMAGMGYAAPPGVSEAQIASYSMPNYADDSVGGVNFVGGRNEAPVKRSVTDLGDGRLFIDGAASPPESGFTLISPPAPPRASLWSRLRGRLFGR